MNGLFNLKKSTKKCFISKKTKSYLNKSCKDNEIQDDCFSESCITSISNIDVDCLELRNKIDNELIFSESCISCEQ